MAGATFVLWRHAGVYVGGVWASTIKCYVSVFTGFELEVRETTSLTATRSLVPYPRPINQSVSGIRALFALPLGRKASLATFELEASSHPLRCPSNIHRSADVSVPPHFLVYLGVSNIGQT